MDKANYPSILNERYAASIILYLSHSPGEIKFSELSHIVKNYHTLEKTLNRLSEAKIVQLRIIDHPYRTNFVRLTPRGYTVSRLVGDVQEIVEEELRVGNCCP